MWQPPTANGRGRTLLLAAAFVVGGLAGLSTSPATASPKPVSEVEPGRPLSGPDPRPAPTIARDILDSQGRGPVPGRNGGFDPGPMRVTVSPNGTRHLRWRPRINGIPVAGDGLQVHVAADGRVLAIHGTPVGDGFPRKSTTGRRTSARFNTKPEVSARRALAVAMRPVVGKEAPVPTVTVHGANRRHAQFNDGSTAELVFAAGERPRLAWEVLAGGGPRADATATLVAADDGTVLSRTSLTDAYSGRGRVWDARPTDPRGWTSFPDRWVTTGTALRGDLTHAFADVLGEGQPSSDSEGNGGEVPASGTGPGGIPEWDEEHTASTAEHQPDSNPLGGVGCSTLYPCSWSSFIPYSWASNLRQATLQAFYFSNRFHDHLEAPPIGFDRASGNFETDTPGGTDGDPVQVSTFVGASHDGGLPHTGVMNNGRMTVFPDGRSPELRLYLFGGQQPSFPVVDGNSAEIAAVVYHEYAHGMLGRLVTDSSGINAMNLIQAGALYEGLADFYALDYLEATGAVSDDPDVPGEILAGEELTRGMTGMRHSAVDCPVEVTGADRCPEDGGFTFADFATISRQDGEPTFEYHADGEIMTQTAWDLRTRLIGAHGREEGIRRTRELVTEALRLLAPEPSYIEFRDGVLLADAASGNRDRDLIWQAFAERGMGVHARGTVTSTYPLADFTVPDTGDADPGDSDPGDPDPGEPGSGGPDPGDRGPTDPGPGRKARPKVVLKLPRLSVRPLRSKRGLPVRIRSNQRVRVRIKLSVPAREARRRGLRRRSRAVILVRTGPRAAGPGRSMLRLKTGRVLRGKLRRIRILRVRLTARIVDGEGRVVLRRFGARLRG